MSQAKLRLDICGESQKSSRSEAMMEVIRQDLSDLRPSKWGIVRRNYVDRITTRVDTSKMQTLTPRRFDLTVRRNSARTCPESQQADPEIYALEAKRQKMARVLRMMGPSTSTPKGSPRVADLTRSTDRRLITRGSRRSLDPHMLSSSYLRKSSLSSLQVDTARQPKLSARRKRLSRRRLSVRQSMELPCDADNSRPASPKSTDSKKHSEQMGKDSNSAMTGRFKKLARLLILLLRGWRLHSKKVHEILDGLGNLPSSVDDEAGAEDRMFNLSYYRTAKEEKVPVRIQSILRKRSNERTGGDIQTLLGVFRNYRCILNYPDKMQQMIAERAWYETYGPKKVVVREGHPPMRFYFLLSGSAVVCAMDDDSRLKTIAQLSRGDSFGERAIINRSSRHSTVISQGHIELLCLTDNDFVDIFMAGGLNDTNDSFLRSLWYLENWPIEKLTENPDKALINYFIRQTVLVPDSNASDWLYIVKSGSCDILTALSKPEIEVPKKLPQLKDFRQQAMDKLRSEDPKYLNHEQLLQLRFNLRAERLEEETMRMRAFLPEINVPTTDRYQMLMAMRGEPSDFLKRKPEREKSLLERLVSQKPHMSLSKRNKRKTKEECTSAGEEIVDVTTLKDSILLRRTGNEDTENQDLVRRGAIEVKQPEKERVFDKNSIFVAVGKLTKGDVFGLQHLVFQRQPSLCLVSSGAELLLINKSFYLQHAPDSLIRKLRSEVIAFPAEQNLQESLEADASWELTRKQSFKQSVERLKYKKVDVNDARSRFPNTSADIY